MEKIIIKNQEDLELAAKNLFYVLRKYVQAVDAFNAVHGTTAKDKMYYWRERAIEVMKNPIKVNHIIERELKIEYDQEQGRPGNE